MLTLCFSGTAKRLDTFLLAACPGLSLGELHKFLRQNKIKTNGKRLPLSTLLAARDEVRLYLSPEAEARAFQPSASGVPLRVLYEDEHLLALDKPAGLVSVAAEEKADSLLYRARLHLAQSQNAPPFASNLQLCHRLDTGTSGVILLAKQEDALHFVQGLLRAHQLEKTYLCIVSGAPQPAQATLRAHLTKDAQRGTVYVKAHPSPGSKPIETTYRTLNTNGQLSLLEVQLHTGRTHQIRAHLASLGLPILGDSKYGRESANRKYRCRYQCLCATSLQFPSAISGPYRHYSGLLLKASLPWFASFPNAFSSP